MKIVSLHPAISITLAQLGRLSALMACTKDCLEAVPELRERDVHVIGNTWLADAEAIVSAGPDIVITCVPYRMETFENILKASLPVMKLSPSTLADIDMDTRLIAGLVQAVAEGEALIERMHEAIAVVRERVPTNARPTIYIEEAQDWVKELVEIAGGKLLDTPEKVEVLLFTSGLPEMRAMPGKRVYSLPERILNTPAMTLVDGLRCIAAALHPNIFSAPPMLRQI